MTFTELAGQWLTTTGGHLSANSRASYQNAIVCAGKHIAALDETLPGQLQTWQNERRPSVSTATFSGELRVIKSVLTWAKEKQGLAIVDCWSDIKAATIRNKTFEIPTTEQFDAIVDAIRQQQGGSCCADFVLFLGLSGARYHEARAVQWRDVNWDKGTLLLARDGLGKTGQRIVPMFPRLLALLQSLPKTFAEESIFCCANPAFRMDKACQSLGIQHVRLHDLRHYACVNWLEKIGIQNANVAAAWAGHSPMQFLNRYSNHVTQTKSTELAKLI